MLPRWVGVGALATYTMTLAACSLLLDWTGYTGGDAGAGVSTADARDGVAAADSGDGGIDAAPPAACGPRTCGGCCEPDGCAGGFAAASCGQGGEACQSCAAQGLACSNGRCGNPPDGGGPPSTCSLIACKTLLTCLATIDIACCLPDGSCGCESILGPSNCQ
jgi:hypothetical protein